MFKEFDSEILKIEKFSDDVSHYRISVPQEFSFIAGQYVLISFDINNQKIRRAYSMASSSNRKGFIEICVKKIGNGPVSTKIHNLKKGDKIKMAGPFGKFIINNEAKRKDLFFIASGVGVSVFVSMISSLLERGFRKKIILLKSSKDEKRSLYDKKFREFKRDYKNFKFYNIFSKPENKNYENIGHVHNFIKKYLPEKFHGNFYICGLAEMVEDTRKSLQNLGVSEDRIFFEKWG